MVRGFEPLVSGHDRYTCILSDSNDCILLTKSTTITALRDSRCSIFCELGELQLTRKDRILDPNAANTYFQILNLDPLSQLICAGKSLGGV